MNTSQTPKCESLSIPVPITHLLLSSGYMDRFLDPELLKELSDFTRGTRIHPVMILIPVYGTMERSDLLLFRPDNRDLEIRRMRTLTDEALIQFLKKEGHDEGILCECSDLVLGLKEALQFPEAVDYCNNRGLCNIDLIQSLDGSLRVAILHFDCESG